MADHKKNVNEKGEEKKGAHGFEKKDHSKEKETATVTKKKPTAVKKR
jgi:hypothetical protein